MNLNGRRRSGLLLEDMLLLTSQNLPRLDLKDNYSIIKELGSGSYGQVLLAVHHTQGTPMALKFLQKSNTELRAFLVEYCVSLSLSAHPCIIGTFGIAFQTDTHYVFAQELAMANDLFSIMKPQIGIPEMTVKRCALQISSALEYMDTKGLVHRDIKPDNILLFDQDCRQVKLTDFGLTCAKGTAVDSMPENLPYTAPEMCILGDTDKLIAHASLDVWAFGVLLFSILTGYFPWNTAASSDKYYLEYTRWHRSSRIFQIPAQWKWFTSEALEMFKKLLAPVPTQRCSPKEIMNYLKTPWKVILHNSNKPDNSHYLQGRVTNKNFLVKRGR
ncbi:serine/threonine-protein kinase SBK1-like [Pleurodeles waltl]